jgi:hypothetical protein
MEAKKTILLVGLVVAVGAAASMVIALRAHEAARQIAIAQREANLERARNGFDRPGAFNPSRTCQLLGRHVPGTIGQSRKQA